MSGAISGDEVTLRQAADMLNVSVEYCQALVSKGVFASAGDRPSRELRKADVLAYLQRRDAIRAAILDELALAGQGCENKCS